MFSLKKISKIIVLMIVLSIATPQKVHAGPAGYGCVAVGVVAFGYSIKTFTEQGFKLSALIKCGILNTAGAGFILGGVILS